MSRLLVRVACALALCVLLPTAKAQDLNGEESLRVFHEVSHADASFRDPFFAPRVETNRVVSIPHNIRWCETETKRIDNFKIAAGAKKGAFDGFYFDDSDVYKVVEGIGSVLAKRRDAQLQEKVEEWIRYFADAQQEDGYLVNYFKLVKPEEKWTNLAGNHELYCAGHLAEAAIEWERSTHDKRLSRISRSFLDLICERYGADAGRLKNVPGHEEIELALVKAGEFYGERKYLDEAKFFVDLRGVPDGRETGLYGELAQDHKPIREQTEIVGHAVRAGYLYSAATDLACIYRDEALLDAMRTLFTDATRRKMYVTGGIGSTGKNEGFEEAFKLPNREAYCETCASIALIRWARRMNLATGEAKYVDVLERAAYNAFAAGSGLDGKSYFYVNPLESTGRVERRPFFSCACCPTNAVRAWAQLSQCAYATTRVADPETPEDGDNAVVVNLYGQGKGRIELADKYVDVEQSTRFPYDGAVMLRVSYRMKSPNAPSTPFYVKTRVPGWAGATSDPDGYRLHKIEPNKDRSATLNLFFPMEVKRISARSEVEADRGRVALQRGPLVYCFEECDNRGTRVDRAVLAKQQKYVVKTTKNFAGAGIDVDAIYCQDVDGATLVAVPYAVWNNRARGRMVVWMRQDGLDPDREQNADDWIDASGDPILYKPIDQNELTDFRCELDETEVDFNASYLEDFHSTFDGNNQATSPESSADYGVPRATWYAKRGTQEWFEYAFVKPRKISSTAVYWFDDEAINGGCRTPESWTLQWQAQGSDEWRDVETTDAFSVDKDREIVVNFTEVEAAKVRLVAKLRKDYSGGILRWTVR